MTDWLITAARGKTQFRVKTRMRLHREATTARSPTGMRPMTRRTPPGAKLLEEVAKRLERT